MSVETEQPQKYTSTTSGAFDSSNVLALSDTQPNIEKFILELNGLKKIINDKKRYELIRYKQPLFTSEFTQDLFTSVFIQVNMITGRTTFTEEQIRRYNEMHGETLAKYLSIIGMRNLVSSNVWVKWLDLVESDEETRNKYNWTYNDQFKLEHLEYTKQRHGIIGESFGQQAILKLVWDETMFLLHGGRNKSQDALILKHEREIIKESYNVTEKDKDTRKEGNFITRLFNRAGE
jgi:hypothetical protein